MVAGSGETSTTARWRAIFVLGLLLFLPSLLIEETYAPFPGALEWVPFLAFWGGLVATLVGAFRCSGSRWRFVLLAGAAAILLVESVARSLPRLVSPSVAWTVFVSWWGAFVVTLVGALGVLRAGARRVGFERGGHRPPPRARSGGPERCRSCEREVPFQAPSCPFCGASLA